MCGLVGIATKSMTKNDVKAFEILLYLDTIRGWDSTGVAMVSNPNARKQVDHIFTHKRAITGMEMLYTRVWNKIGTTAVQHGRVLMGHNRAATKGAVCDMNAHPFNHDDITLMHNGSLSTWRTLGGQNNFTVDSEAICWALAQQDSYDDMKKVISEINGAFALTWHDSTDDTINFVRNEERPLHYAEVLNYTRQSRGWIWASEPEFIEIAARKAGLTIGDIKELEVGRWVSVSVDTLEIVSSEEVEVHVPKKHKTYTVIGGTTSQTKTGNQSSSGKSGAGAAVPPGGSTNTRDSNPCPSTNEYFEWIVDVDSFQPYHSSNAAKPCDQYGYVTGCGFIEGKEFKVTMHNARFGDLQDGVYRSKCTTRVPTTVPRNFLADYTVHTTGKLGFHVGRTPEMGGSTWCRMFKPYTPDAKSAGRVITGVQPCNSWPYCAKSVAHIKSAVAQLHKDKIAKLEALEADEASQAYANALIEEAHGNVKKSKALVVLK